MKRLGIAAMLLLALGLGLWIGWNKDAISACLSGWHGELSRATPPSSPSPGPLALTESPVEAAVQTPDSWPSLVDQLRREGVELRDRGDMTTAVDRLQEALDSEPNNASVLTELAKTYDLMKLHDRANEIRRKVNEMGPSVDAAQELADRGLKLEATTPAAIARPTIPDSTLHEMSASPSGTADDVAKYAIKAPEHEIDQVSPLPTSTPLEVLSPVVRAIPAEPSPSAETSLANESGRLVVLRAANFGWNLAVNLKIDGRTAANIVQGRRYDEPLPAGRHTLTVSAVPNYHPTSTLLNVQHGQTYVFTVTRQNTDGVVLVPSALPAGESH
jgi:tetratricopeptide (TPR) repeat protein